MSESTLAFLYMIAVIIIAVFVLGRVNEKRRDRELTKKLSDSFGKIPKKKTGAERYENIGGYLKRHKKPGGIDEITWNDLDMDSVFKRIDDTESSVGEEYLYYLLHSPGNPSDDDRRLPKEAVSFFEEDGHKKDRTAVQKILMDLGYMGKYSFYDYLDLVAKAKKQSPAKHYIAFILPFISIALMFFDGRAGVILLVLVIIINMTTYVREKGRIDGYLSCIRYILRMKKTGERILSLGISIPGEDLDTLRSDTKALSGFARGSFLVTGTGSGNPLDVVLDYIRMIFHADLIKFAGMVGDVKTHRDKIDEISTIIGRIDAEITAASFRKSLPYWCLPVFQEEKEKKVSLEVQGLFHPLLANPVANDMTAERSILLTGSNASGKSTFLKSVALAALLGQTMYTCPAKKYKAPAFYICSSMALRDSISKGESYFMVEIRSLKRIRDAAGKAEGAGTPPVLAFIDEVLRGTNTVERIAASTEILHDLAGRRILIFAATHDGELTESLAEDFDNYHFEEYWNGKDVTFSYRLHEGRATTRNAIRLLSAVGFDEDVTKKAEKLAGDFEKTGEWNWKEI